MGEVEQKNLYYISVMVERIGQKRRGKNAPKDWGRAKIVAAYTDVEAFYKICDLYHGRQNRKYKITLRECTVLARCNDQQEELERYYNDTV